MDSQNVTSGPRAGRRGGDGHKKAKGIERHILTGAMGLLLTVLVTAANAHDTRAAGPLLDRAAAEGWRPKRVLVDGIYKGARMDHAAQRHGLDVQVSSKPPQAGAFTPVPLRWRAEATRDSQTNRYRRLPRNLE